LFKYIQFQYTAGVDYSERTIATHTHIVSHEYPGV